MAETGQVKADPLFVGLTRPTMFLGVSFLFVICYGFVCAIYFINFSDFKVFPMAVAFHLMGYVICFKEPLFVELYLIKSQKCTKCKNKLYHGANSYDMT